jgi:polyhydroxyalkanoate synthesis repressor PhaR
MSLDRVVELRKYPNRRYYNVGRGRHETLGELHELVRKGYQIHVTDSKTGQDITNQVLAQIILELDPPKLDLFPASLLHQAIQANQQMVRKFVEQYFAQAVEAFSRSRRQFEEFLEKSGFSSLTSNAPFDWARMLFPGMSGTNAPSAATSDADVRALREKVEMLTDELAQLRRGATKTAKRPSRKRT